MAHMVWLGVEFDEIFQRGEEPRRIASVFSSLGTYKGLNISRDDQWFRTITLRFTLDTDNIPQSFINTFQAKGDVYNSLMPRRRVKDFKIEFMMPMLPNEVISFDIPEQWVGLEVADPSSMLQLRSSIVNALELRAKVMYKSQPQFEWVEHQIRTREEIFDPYYTENTINMNVLDHLIQHPVKDLSSDVMAAISYPRAKIQFQKSQLITQAWDFSPSGKKWPHQTAYQERNGIKDTEADPDFMDITPRKSPSPILKQSSTQVLVDHKSENHQVRKPQFIPPVWDFSDAGKASPDQTAWEDMEDEEADPDVMDTTPPTSPLPILGQSSTQVQLDHKIEEHPPPGWLPPWDYMALLFPIVVLLPIWWGLEYLLVSG